ncbi:MAG: helix-turn-helix transcriptional regulator [Clostridiales bacterium]|nr:helix-turn-helix transcriptional regulator [Clostridiales bacterium]
MAVTTNALLKRIVNGRDFKEVLSENEGGFEEQSVSEYLRKLCEERGLVPEQVIKKSQIDRTYGHQIFNGTRIPSRDKLIKLAFGFGLSLDETQKLLKIAGRSILYPKIKRDAALIFGISHGMNVMEMQYLLASINVVLLGES